MATLTRQKQSFMKTTSYLRIFIVLSTMMVVACSDPMIEPTVPRNPRKGTQTAQIATPVEFHTSVTTWTLGEDGTFIGLVTQTPVTDLATVDVFIVKDGKRIAIDRELDESKENSSQVLYGEYYWASHRNNVLLLNYIGKIPGSVPPFPLQVIIVY